MILGFDPILMLIGLACGALSLIAAGMVKTRFAQGSRVPLASRIRGCEVAQAILDDEGITDVRIVEHQGFLSDHYNPLTRTLALSPDVYGGSNAAAAGVAAHEVGHAIQHARGYAPMWLRSLLVPVASLGSNLAPILIMIGVMLGAANASAQAHPGIGFWLAVAGLGLFAVATAFTLVTVPVEFDASARAKTRLVALGIVRDGVEADAVRGVLFAAGLTYVAAAVTALLHLLYYAWLVFGRRRE